MANYYASARTNYFKVKDLDKFKEEMNKHEVEVVSQEDKVAVLSCNGEGAGFPSYDHETDEDLDFARIVSTHLEEEEVAIFMEVGAEKLRYLVGIAEAINSKGEVRIISLDNIYKEAEELGKNVTAVEY